MPRRSYNRTVVPSSQIAADTPSLQIDATEFAKYGSFALKMMLKTGIKTCSDLGKHEQGMISFTELRLRTSNLAMGFHGLDNPPTLIALMKIRKRKADFGIEIICNVFDRIYPQQIIGLGDDVSRVNPAEDSTKNAIAGDDILPVDLVKVMYGENILLVDLGDGTRWWDDMTEDEIVEDTSEDDIYEIDILQVNLYEDVVEDCILVAYMDGDASEDDVSQIASDLRREREKLVCLGSRIGTRRFLTELERMQSNLFPGELMLDSLFETFKNLKEEYKLGKLSIMAFLYKYPMLVEVFQG